MNPYAIGLIWFAGIFVLIILFKVPLAAAMGLCGFFGLISIKGFSNAGNIVGYMAWDATYNYVYSAIPFFMLMGFLASATELSSDAFLGLKKWVGRLPGGLAIATVGACGAFAAVSGSSITTATSLGAISYDEMRKNNYSRELAAGSICAGGTIGSMIPPSIPLVIIAMLTEQSSGKVLMAGLLPGILTIVVYSLIILSFTTINPMAGPRSEPSNLKGMLFGLYKLWPILVIFLVVMIGIYLGLFTPTVGGAIGSFVTIVIGIARKKLSWAKLREAFLDTGVSAGSLLVILVGALIFNSLLTASELPQFLVTWIGGLTIPSWGIVGLIVILYLIAGATMSTMAMILLFVPMTYTILVPSLGFNAIWFAIIVDRLSEIGSITPPIGMVCFAFHTTVTKFEAITINQVFKGIGIFLIGDAICLSILLFWPGFTLFLPNMMLR